MPPPSTTRCAVRPRPSGAGRAWRRPNGLRPCGRSRPRSTPTSTSWPPLRSPIPGTRSGPPEWEAGHVRDVLNFYAAGPERLSGKQIPVVGGLDVTFHEPLGVVGVITPWNFPMMIASWGIAPALAAGNAVLVKPAEWTPLTTIRLGELAAEAGLDADLLQVLPGAGAVVGQRFVTNPASRQGRLHRVHRSRQEGDGRGGRSGQAGHAGARRQKRQHRLRRLRPGTRGGDRTGRGVR